MYMYCYCYCIDDTRVPRDMCCILNLAMYKSVTDRQMNRQERQRKDDRKVVPMPQLTWATKKMHTDEIRRV